MQARLLSHVGLGYMPGQGMWAPQWCRRRQKCKLVSWYQEVGSGDMSVGCVGHPQQQNWACVHLEGYWLREACACVFCTPLDRVWRLSGGSREMPYS